MGSLVKLSSKVKELRFLVSNTNSSGAGLRDFIVKHYLSLKSNNPHIKLMIREGEGISPKVFARYEYGQEASLSVANSSSDDILSKLITLDKK